MGRSGHPALIIGVIAVAVAATGVVVVVTHGGEPVSRAATTVTNVHGAVVVRPNGVASLAHNGEQVMPGDVVRTSADGSAELVTRSRTVYLAARTAVAVIDGARQQLRTGSAVVDAQRGPGLTFEVAGDTVDVPQGSAVVADRRAAVRIGTLAGSARVASDTGRQLVVQALMQAVISGDALPSVPTPLRLTDDAGEAHAAPALVDDDLALKTLGQGIDTSRAATTTRVVEASWQGTDLSVPANSPGSERVLPVLIADSTYAGGTIQQRYDHAVTWRDQGGSWGVVDHLLAGRAAAAVRVFALLTRDTGTGTGQGGTVTASGPGTTLGPILAPPTRTGTHAGTPGGHPGGSVPPTTSKPTQPVGNPPGAPSTQATGLLGGLISLTGKSLAGLLSLLPLNTLTSALTNVPQPQSTVAPHSVTATPGTAAAGTSRGSTRPHHQQTATAGTTGAPKPHHTATTHHTPVTHKKKVVPLLTGLLNTLFGN